MSWLPEDVKEASGGEVIDRTARDAIRLAHRALERFPDLVRKHKVIAGGAAISSSLVVLAGVAITRRVLKGQSAEDAVRTVTEAELQGIVSPEERRQSSRRPTNGAVRPSTPEERHLATGAHIARRHVSPGGPAAPTSGDPSHR